MAKTAKRQEPTASVAEGKLTNRATLLLIVAGMVIGLFATLVMRFVGGKIGF